MSTTRLYMKTTTIFLICLYSSLLHAESGKYDASKIVEPTPEMLKMTSAELFKEIDRDGDGQVSFTETNEALEYSPQHTKRKFAKSDRDKSGGLNFKEFEFRLTRTEWWNLSRETPEAMFKAADANQNGTLSKKEFAIFQKRKLTWMSSSIERIWINREVWISKKAPSLSIMRFSRAEN